MRFSFVVLCSIWLSLGVATKTDVFNLSMIDWIANFPPGNPPALLVPIQLHTAGRLAIDLVNNGTFPDILPNTHINLEVVIDGFSASKAIAAMIDFSEKGHTLAIGFPLSDIALPTATVGTVYGVAQIASAASAAPLSDKSLYPYFSRLASAPSGYPHTIKEALIYYESIRGRGWTDVAVISAVASFVNNIATTFIDISEPEITILTFQQFLLDQFAVGNLDVEFRELERSGARVFFAPIFDGWLKFLGIADSYGLVGDHYVWIAPPSIVGVPYPEPSELARGSIGAVFATRTPDDPILQNFLEIWTSVDPDIYIGAGPGATFGGSFVSIAFDTGIAAAMAIDKLEKSGQLSGSISPELWSETIRSLEFEGLSNDVSFLPNGDRVGKFNLQYYNTEANNWFTSATWTALDGYEYKEDVIWYSNSTEIPDLDIRDPFNYWSCHDKEKKRDPTGKTVSLQTPDSEDVDDIDSTYHCDNFIDCWNMSDESVDCSANYVGVFIAFGIVTGLLILLSILFFVVVIIFGVVLGYRRMRTASPFFLNVLLLSVILGYCSTYAWYGKPHKVACAFQPWLLGLSSISMIACLAVKNLRIWRIFKFPLKKTKITNAELLIFWLIVMIPAIIILILWTIISTPTAGMEERKDEDHYVCKTGGFTGSPGGLIFFFILVGYTALVLVFAAIISILIRNVPSQFSEVRLLTISIYNLGFLSVVIIPVYLVVQPFNPFIAWILRTSAILYAFTATLFIQFVPIIIGIFLFDKGQNNAKFKSFIKSDLAFANANNSDEPSITNSKA